MPQRRLSPPGAECSGARSGRSDGALLQEGFVDAPDYDYLAPSLAVDANGNIGMGCTRTSETEFPSVCVLMHAAGDPKNTMRPPVLAAKGTTVFSSNRPSKYGLAWGNYNTTCLDPSDPTIFWTYQEYATSKSLRNTPPAGLPSSSSERQASED